MTPKQIKDKIWPKPLDGVCVFIDTRAEQNTLLRALDKQSRHFQAYNDKGNLALNKTGTKLQCFANPGDGLKYPVDAVKKAVQEFIGKKFIPWTFFTFEHRPDSLGICILECQEAKRDEALVPAMPDKTKAKPAKAKTKTPAKAKKPGKRNTVKKG